MTCKSVARDLVLAVPALTLKEAQTAVTALASSIGLNLWLGNSVTLPGLGTFSVETSAARVGRNPRNPTVPINIPAKRRIKFKTTPARLLALNS